MPTAVAIVSSIPAPLAIIATAEAIAAASVVATVVVVAPLSTSCVAAEGDKNVKLENEEVSLFPTLFT
jgi:hypothetical protein